MEWLFWVLAAAFGCLGYFVLRIVTVIWWKPLQVKKCFESQGVRGPPYRLLNGNFADMVRMNTQAKSTPIPWSHDIVPRVLPYYHHWTKTYGKDFIYWVGSKPRLNVPHPELIKEILSNKFGHYENISSNPLGRQLVGQGLVGLRGEKWVQHRRIINPAFHLDFLKGMVPTIVESTANMLEKWGKLVLSGAEEVEVLKEFCNLTADVISRTALGSSYAEAKHIFNLQDQQMLLTAELVLSVYVPGFRFLPTRKNRQRWKLEKEIRKCMRQVIEARERTADIEQSGSYGTDLLGLMMSAKNKRVGGKLQDVRMTTEEIIDECKTFYFAGHETTSILLTWTIILLGMHQDWQDRGRKEVLEVCGKNVVPDADSVNHLKIVGMILNEALRLYPPAVFLQRQAVKPMNLGRLSIPAGTQLFLPILAIHHDQCLWGNDANEFNPARFSEGIAKAVKHPLAFMPFGFGPRICVGQNFALLEAKVVLAMILQRFSFVTSPSYAHAPVMVVTMRPQHGAQGTVPTIVESTAKMLEEWSKLVLAGAEEFEMLKEFRNVTADLISRTAFGSSYAEGKHIFNLQGQQMALAAELMSTFYIPGFRFLPTRKNRQHWKLEKEIRRGMMQVIEARERTANIEKSGNYGTDLLGIMMSAKDKQVGGNLRDVRMTTEEIIDECKTFYVTGHQTTATLLTWTIILLAMHQDWQERGRKEVLEVCGKNVYPDGDSVNHLKIVGMILNEALRLYPPAVAALRQAEKPVKLGRFSLPAGTQLMIPILAMHHDPALWGNDANEFNPGRFSEGIAKATKHPLAFMPFGSGPRTCVGQNFALLEAKVVLAMFLQRFSFVTSPSYVHAPTVAFTLQPQHGAQVILRMN